VSFATIPGTAPLRGVVAGAGKLGPLWARELIESPETELAGWVDLEPSRVRSEAAALGVPDVPAGAVLEEMLDAQRPDFVVNVTAPGAHRAVTIAALERGAAVLSEKPLAATMAEAREMVATADRVERLFMVSQNRRYMPGLIAFRETVAALGTLSELSCDFYLAHREDAAEFLFTFPHPLLLDMAIHLFDGARAITGASPLSVYCDAYNPPYSWYAGAAAASAIFRMSDDLRFTFKGNWAADGFQTSWTGSWRAVGELGSATWDGENAPRVEAGPGATIVAAVPAEPAVVDETRFFGLAVALAEFVRALRTGAVPAGECHDNLLSLAMCHAAVESSALGEPVDVDPERAPA
jgi:predicted dehydrogenase